MKNLRVRKWLRSQPNELIELSKEDIKRLGRDDVKKIIINSSKENKNVRITAQDVHDYSTGAGKPWTTMKSIWNLSTEELALLNAGFK